MQSSMLQMRIMIIGLLLFCSMKSYAQYEWKRYCELSVPRQYFQALYIGNNEILVMGGLTNVTGAGVGNPTRSCEIINTVNGTVSFTDSMSSARAEFIALLTPDSNVVVVSGFNNQQASTLTSTVELFNRTTKKWSIIGNLQVARRQHGAVMISNTEILVVGGRLADLTSTATAEIFDLTTKTSTLVRDYPFALNGVNLARMKNGAIVGFGGRVAGASSSRPTDISQFISRTNIWTKIGNMPTGINATSYMNTWDGRLFINGGNFAEGTPQTGVKWTYLEGIKGEFYALENMRDDRRWHCTAQLTSDTLLISAGWDPQPFPHSSVEWVDIKTGKVTPGPSHIESHAWHQLVSVPLTKNNQGIPTRGRLFAISGMKTSNTATPLVEVLDAMCTIKPTLTINRSVICGGDTTLMDAGQGFTMYRWNTGEQTRTIVARTGGLYWVEVTDANGCTGRDSTTFSVKPQPSISVSVLPESAICRGRSAKLMALGGVIGTTYNWTPTTGLSDATKADPILTLSSDGTYTYTVTATNTEGCSLSRQVSITVQPCNTELSVSTTSTEFISCDSLLSSITMTNESSQAITIDSLSLVGGALREGAMLDEAYFSQVVGQMFPMTIQPNNVSPTIPIRIVPIRTGDYAIDVVAYYGDGKTQVASVVGKSVRRDMKITLPGVQVEVNKNFELPVLAESGYWADLKVNQIEITLSYRKGVMEYAGDDALRVSTALGSAWQGSRVSSLDDTNGNKNILIRLESLLPSTYLTKNDTLLHIGFILRSLEPGKMSTQPSISYTLPGKRLDCWNKLSQTQPISVMMCGANLRPVSFGEETFRIVSVIPNPANPTLTIQYGVGFDSHLELKLYDVNGREVRTFVKGMHKGGLFQVIADVSDLSEGVYYLIMTSGGNTFTEQVRIVR